MESEELYDIAEELLVELDKRCEFLIDQITVINSMMMVKQADSVAQLLRSGDYD